MPTSAEFRLDSRPGVIAWRGESKQGEIKLSYITHYFNFKDIYEKTLETIFIGCQQEDEFGLLYLFRHDILGVPHLDYLAHNLIRPEFAEGFLKNAKKIRNKYSRRIISTVGKGCLYIAHTPK